MKLSRSVLSSVIVLLTGVAVAKNVVDVNFSPEQVKNAVLEIEQGDFNLGKREAKNVVNLNLFIDENEYKLHKRDAKADAKNVFVANLIIDDDELTKRDGKNVFNTNLIIDDASLEKRDGKNVFTLNMVVDEDELFQKREADAKNVVNINLIIDENSDLVKRDISNFFNISLSIAKESLNFKSILEDPLNLGYLIGDEEYTATSIDKVDDNNINVKLKENKEGCHRMKQKLDLKSVSPILNTFKEKSFDPVIEAKDKFVIPDSIESADSNVDASILYPNNGDIATALVQREDLVYFFKYLREFPDLYQKFTEVKAESEEASKKQLIIFAPNNEAIQSLNKKPWQFPEDIENARSEDEEDMLIQRNIFNFVESHIAETKSFDIDSSSHSIELTTFNGKSILLKNDDGIFWVKPKESDDWLEIMDTEVLENGAILTVSKPLVS